MVSTRFVKIAASGLAAGMALTGGHAGPVSHSESTVENQQLQIASTAAVKATAALAAGNDRIAVAQAEAAVAHSPRDASYRMLLGQAYLSAGRFTSAETSFSDVLRLSPDNARAALNLALSEVAQGKRERALSTLVDYRDKLSVSDYGLAVALAGDVEGAIGTLENAVRDGASDAKTRQNLALAYAMAGRWSNARIMASQDLSTPEVDARLGQWMSFVRPRADADQVASLLGVTPASDAGQPQQLALAAPANVQVAAAEPVVEAPAPVIAEAPAPVFETATVAAAEAPIFRAAPAPIKQIIVPASRPVAGAVTAPVVGPKRSVQAGRFVVQLGAFANAAVSRNSWGRMAPRYGLTGFDPANSFAKVRGASFVRLSIGGFATRTEATQVCTRIKNAGGNCFVRGLLGDAPAQWVQRGLPRAKKAVRLAAR